MTTGKNAAHDASKVLRSKTATRKMKEIAASDLAQARHQKKGKKK